MSGTSVVDKVSEFARVGDEIQSRLFAAAERVDRLDATLPYSERPKILRELRQLWAIGDELASHHSRVRACLTLD